MYIIIIIIITLCLTGTPASLRSVATILFYRHSSQSSFCSNYTVFYRYSSQSSQYRKRWGAWQALLGAGLNGYRRGNISLKAREISYIVTYLAIFHYLIVMIKISIYHSYVDSILHTAILLLKRLLCTNIALYWLLRE